MKHATLLPAVLAGLALASLSHAQTSCATLSTTGTGKAGTTYTITLKGSLSRAHTWAVWGPETGKTTIKLGPIGTVNLGLVSPFSIHPIGFTDGKGTWSRTIKVPSILAKQFSTFAQAVSIKHENGKGKAGWKVCESNVVKITVGGS